jgi:AraC-like DNA-binding protein
MLIEADFTRKNEQSRMALARSLIEATIARHVGAKDPGPTVVPGLSVARLASALAPTSYLFEPSLCISARGAKRVLLGNTTYIYDEAHFLLTAIGLPTIVEVCDASPQTPYTALQLTLDLEVARQLIADIDLHGLDTVRAQAAIATGPVTPELLDAAVRLVALLDKPQDIPILNRLIHREILYRVLTGSAGDRLRQIVRIGSQTGRIAKAVTWLRANFSRRLRIKELAEATGMGISTLHHHFRELTTMTPLQYQKHLRLHEARRLMLSDEIDAASAALRVGYESATQFNREYRRLFGMPPIRDVKTLRNVKESSHGKHETRDRQPRLGRGAGG